jgi:hypothetical protein
MFAALMRRRKKMLETKICISEVRLYMKDDPFNGSRHFDFQFMQNIKCALSERGCKDSGDV